MGKTIYIIAEAGVNHNGSVKTALQLVDAAADAGADAVKFQTFKAEKLVCRYAEKADYQKKNSATEESQFSMLKKLEFGADVYKELLQYCLHKNIEFLSSPFDLESIDLLAGLGLQVFKIPSGEITNLPYLQKIGSLRKKVIMSSGMATLQEIGDAIAILLHAGTRKEDLVILHCNTEYPTPLKDVNLRAMSTIAETFDVAVGYSDHTQGIEVSVAAAALGAVVIEKHFTLDRQLPGPDHRASIEPHEFKHLVTSVRNICTALGNPEKVPSVSEMNNREIVRKSIVASIPIRMGEVLTEKNLTVKRPGTGLSPMMWNKVLGRIALRDYEQDQQIEI